MEGQEAIGKEETGMRSLCKCVCAHACTRVGVLPGSPALSRCSRSGGQHGFQFGEDILENCMGETQVLLSIMLRHPVFLQAAAEKHDTIFWGSSKT